LPLDASRCAAAQSCCREQLFARLLKALLASSIISKVGAHSLLVLLFWCPAGAGAASLYVPRYIAEVAPPALRGWLGSLNQVQDGSNSSSSSSAYYSLQQQ
jgi:hypothetical protein